MKKINQLTFTRFLAALSVLLYHSGGVFPFNIHPFSNLFASGQIAVGYFFVLSGFVMSLAYYRPEKKFELGSYYLSRFLRVYPTYLLSFLLTCLYYIHLMARIDSKKFLANLFLLQAWIPDYVVSFNYVSWSLSVEVFLYAIFPFLVPFFARFSVRILIWFSVIFWGAGSLFHTALLAAWLPEAHFILYYNPLVYLSGFILGVVAGIWYLQVNKESIKQKFNLIFLLMGVAILAFLLITRGSFAPPLAFATLSTGLLAPIFTLILLTLALDTTHISKILSHKWLILLGDASYTLFILNIPIRWFMERWVTGLGIQLSNNLFYYLFIPFIILLSVFIYQKFEHPAREWLSKNAQMLWLFVLDGIAIWLAIFLSYCLRLGFYDLYYYNWRIFLFTVRSAIPVVVIFLLLFRLYQPNIGGVLKMVLARRMIVPIFLSGLLLSALLYWAFESEIVENFPRSILLFSFPMLFGFTCLTRFIFLNRVNMVSKYRTG